MQVWAAVAAFLLDEKKGISELYRPDELLAVISNDPAATLWVAWDEVVEGLMISKICRDVNEKYIYIEAANCKNLRKYMPFAVEFEHWAVMAGAKSIRFECPHTLARILRRYGYSQPTAMVRKRIQPLWRV